MQACLGELVTLADVCPGTASVNPFPGMRRHFGCSAERVCEEELGLTAQAHYGIHYGSALDLSILSRCHPLLHRQLSFELLFHRLLSSS